MVPWIGRYGRKPRKSAPAGPPHHRGSGSSVRTLSAELGSRGGRRSTDRSTGPTTPAGRQPGRGNTLPTTVFARRSDTARTTVFARRSDTARTTVFARRSDTARTTVFARRGDTVRRSDTTTVCRRCARRAFEVSAPHHGARAAASGATSERHRQNRSAARSRGAGGSRSRNGTRCIHRHRKDRSAAGGSCARSVRRADECARYRSFLAHSVFSHAVDHRWLSRPGSLAGADAGRTSSTRATQELGGVGLGRSHQAASFPAA
jgi:hypothetical protein